MINVDSQEMADWMRSYISDVPRYLYGRSGEWQYKDWFRYKNLLVLLWKLNIRPERNG